MMYKKMLFFFVFFWQSSFEIRAAVQETSFFVPFTVDLQFSPEIIDVLLKTKQFQAIRNFCYSLTREPRHKVPLLYLQKKSLQDPALAYLVARTLKDHEYPMLDWKFLIHLFLLYVHVCSARCQNLELLQEKAPIDLFKKHIEYKDMYQFIPSEKELIKKKLEEWRASFSEWASLPDPSWIFCCRSTSQWVNACGYQSIIYESYQEVYKTYFLRVDREEEKAAIEALCQRTYELWMERYR
jgi:hypothetical protein